MLKAFDFPKPVACPYHCMGRANTRNIIKTTWWHDMAAGETVKDVVGGKICPVIFAGRRQKVTFR